MPVGRIILKSISESKKLSELKTDGARLLYTWLIPHLDINGCFSGDAEVVKGKIFTRLKKSTKTIESYLEDMENAKLIIRYEIKGDIFLHSPDFKEKQPSLNPNKEGKPLIPKPTPELLQSYYGQSQDLPSTSKVKQSKVKQNKEEKKISFNFDSKKWEYIKNEDVERWKETYPTCNIPNELLKMADWLISNPEKRKQNYRAFISRWLSRTQSQDKPQLKVGKDTKKYTDKEKEEQEKFLKFHRECKEKAVKKYQDKMDIAKKANDKDAYDDVMDLIQNETSRLVNKARL